MNKREITEAELEANRGLDPDLERLSYILRRKKINFAADETITATSLFTELMARPSFRDIILKMQTEAPGFIVFQDFANQQRFHTMLKSVSEDVTDVLNNCLIQTPSTREITILSLPVDLPFFIYMSATADLTATQL